jgi:glycosyltransferase involved in cell wall biosynthesis
MTGETVSVTAEVSATVEIPDILRNLRVALIHDYLNQQGGAERVVQVLTEMFPGAPLYTSVYDRERMPASWRRLDIRTSYLQRISPRVSLARVMLPLYPTAFEAFNLDAYDLVISSATTFAKGVLTRPETCHICYCSNPTRLLWMYHDYMEYESLPRIVHRLLPWLVTPMRTWDFLAAQRVDYFLANSRNAQRRIAKFYRRESDVVHPPIDASRFSPVDKPEDYFLVVARLQPYKRIDLAVQACSRLGVPLRVIGEGPDRGRLEALAGPTVSFLGRRGDEEVAAAMARCRAYVQPGEEDFGMAPLEAQAAGRPVIAYRAGGALETVEEGITGVFFDYPTMDCLAATLNEFRDTFDPATLRAHAVTFDLPVFREMLYEVIARRYAEFQKVLDA